MTKILVSSSALLRCLKQVAVVVSRSPILPVLEGVLFLRDGNMLSVTGSDLENSVTIQLPVESNAESFCIVPPLRPLLEVLANLPDQPITLAVGAKEGQLTLSAVTGDAENPQTGAKYTFSCDKGADYPKTPAARTDVTIALPGHLLRTAIGYTADLVSNDELRPAMTALNVKASADGIEFVATDGHRLVHYNAPTGKEPGYSFESAAAKTMLIPRKALKALKHLVKNDDTVTITTGTDNSAQVHFQIGTYGPSLIVRPIDERYPDWQNIVPVAFGGGTLTLSRPAAKSMLTRLKPFAPKHNNQVVLHLSKEGSYAKCKSDMDDSEAQEPLPGTMAMGEMPAIGFNIRFLSQILTLLPGPRVRLQFTKPTSGCLVTSDSQDGLRYLLMPVALPQPN